MKVAAIIQARLGSTRLPEKVLTDLAGEPMLARVFRRTAMAERLDEVVVATTTAPADERIERLCEDRGWPCFRGSEDDVLDRYCRAAVARDAEVVVRITADCPLIEPAVVDRVMGEFLTRCPEIDYVSNIAPRRTYPRGLDTEVVSFEALRRIWAEVSDAEYREHVTLYIRRHAETFRIHNVTNVTDLSGMRWTVDTPEDLAFVRRIYGHFGDDRFSWKEVLALLQQHPEWLEINRHIQQKAV